MLSPSFSLFSLNFLLLLLLCCMLTMFVSQTNGKWREKNNFNVQNKKPSVFVSTYEDGIKRVLEGNYAFLMESTMLDYERQRDCNLTQIGGKY